MEAPSATEKTVRIRTRTHRRRSCIGSAILVLAALLILVGLAAAAILWNLPSQAEKTFGPPSAQIGRAKTIAYSALMLLQSRDLTKPVDPSGAARPFHISSGESTPSVVGRLWDEGFISNPTAFSTFLRYSGLDTSLQAGDYQISPAMSPIAIAHALQNATPAQVTFHVLPGWRLEEIAASLPTSGLNITPDEFMSAARSHPKGYSFVDKLPESASLEGFLFPGSYVFDRKANADQIIRSMLDAFDTQVTPEIRQGFKHQGLSLYQAVTLASMVQREAMVTNEMPLIASVFLNRLAAGMKLDSDPTVQYALGFNSQKNTWWTNPLSLEDLKVDSPYNTYQNDGLPPGPISNPSLSALKAVAFPAQTPYYYFRATCDGSGKHSFSETFQEHLQNSCP